MNGRVRDEFTALAEATMMRADKIDCSVTEFIVGIEIVITKLLDARTAAMECARATGVTPLIEILEPDPEGAERLKENLDEP